MSDQNVTFVLKSKWEVKKTREEVCKSLVHSADILPLDSTTLSKKHKVKSTRKEPIVKVSSCKGSA